MPKINNGSEKKKNKRYSGKLAAKQISEGMNYANANARRLLSDAELLFQNKRYPSALGLAILAIEESGKDRILRSIAVNNKDEDLAKSWKEYRSHLAKNILWIIPELVKSGARVIDDFRQMVDKESEHPYLLDSIKQISFYTDCFGSNIWSNPDDVIREDIAKTIIQTAKILIKDREITKTEIELWIKHIGPVWRKDFKMMKNALIEWAADMKAHGLLEEKKENGFKEFVNQKEWIH